MAFTRVWIRSSLTVMLTLFIAASGNVSAQLPDLIPLQVRPAGSYLGLRLLDLDEERAKSLKLSELIGVEIAAVEEGGAADQAGIRPGDVILSYNGEKILGSQHFIRLVVETPPGRHVRLVCWRSGALKEISVVTGSPRSITSPEGMDLSRIRVTDVPSPLMLWRNLILGLESISMNEQMEQAFGVKQGILVWTVTPSYPAQRAGLRAGDVVTGFCGHAIHSPRELGVIMQQLQNGPKPVSVDLVREHKLISVPLSLDGER